MATKRITTTFSCCPYTIRVSKNTLELLNNPPYILFMINTKTRKVAYIPSETPDRDAIKINYKNIDIRMCVYVSSAKLVKRLYKMEKWDKELRYQISGSFVDGMNLVEFSLEEAHSVANDILDEDTYVDPEYDIKMNDYDRGEQ